MRNASFYTGIMLVATLFVWSCQQKTEGWPEDLAGKKALLKEKQSELKKIKADLKKLEAEIDSLDPSSVKAAKLVTTRTIKRDLFEHFVEIQSSVQSDDVVMASSETGGRILSVNVKEGQQVRKGALIAKLDLETIDKQIEELESSLGLATTIYERQSRLWDKNIGSEIQYLEAKTNKERLEKSLETLKHQLRKANVYAPMSGVVDRVFLKQGEMSGSGTPIAQILNTQKVKVVADVPENYLSSIERGQKVTVQFPAIDEEHVARIARIGSTIHPSNRTFAVEVEMSNKSGFLKPNLLATMLLKDYEQAKAITVPSELIQQEVSGRDFVYVKGNGEDGSIAQKVYVEVGLSADNEIEIVKGLEEGQQVIVKGARNLSDNEPIEAQPESTKAENG